MTYKYSLDALPKEQFVCHAAGQDGRGSASYIDAPVLRQRNVSAAWPAALALGEGVSASDPSYDLGERVYYLQNWRADVVAVVGGGGAQIAGVDMAAAASSNASRTRRTACRA